MPLRTPHEPIFKRPIVHGSPPLIGGVPITPAGVITLLGALDLGDIDLVSLVERDGRVFVLHSDAGGSVTSVDCSNPDLITVLDTITGIGAVGVSDGIVSGMGGTSTLMVIGDDLIPVTVDIDGLLSTAGTTPLTGAFGRRGATLDATADELYVSSSTFNGLLRIDVSTPSTPALLDTFTSFPAITNPQDIWVYSTHAIMADGNVPGLHSIDIVGTITLAATETGGSADTLTLAVPTSFGIPTGTTIYAGSPTGVSSFDVTDPANPTLLVSDVVTPGPVRNSIAANPAFLVVPGVDGVLRAYDTIDPGNPVLYASLADVDEPLAGASEIVTGFGQRFYTLTQMGPVNVSLSVWEVV